MMLRTLTAALLLCAATSSIAAEECKPSEWGPDDQAGAANRITPTSVLDAAKLIKTGKTYSLGIIIDATSRI